MTDLEVLIGLNSIDIGFKRLNLLLEYFDTPQNIVKAALDKLSRIEGIGGKIAPKIVSIKKQDFGEELQKAEKLGLSIITINDPGYPQNLKEIFDPPIVLYVKGDFAAEDKFSIAIVGSRRASFYGLTCAEKFAQELSNLGFTIVSGMARGIDTAAHKGALKNNGRTIAVMGSGFEQIYPAENKDLAEEIAENGAVVSEFPIATAPIPQNFPRRNRIISGLAKGVLVVEAARNSGALITADFALEQGREVFSLPGKIDAQNSCGTNFLIKQGAKLVSTVEDIIEELNMEFPNQGLENKTKVAASEECASNIELDKAEKVIYNSLSSNPLSLDEVCEIAGVDVSRVMTALFRLELKKIIRQLPGKRYVREHHG